MFESVQCFKDLIAAVKAGDYVTALEHFSHLSAAAWKLAAALKGGKVFNSTPAHAAEVEAIKGELESLLAKPTAFGADPVGKLGDGVLLKQLIELAIKLLPLFL
jgi:hypothetical protein